MSNKNWSVVGSRWSVTAFVVLALFFLFPAFAENPAPFAAAAQPNPLQAVIAPDPAATDAGAGAVMEYQVDGSLFQKIADLEQEKVLLQLEKEKSQLRLDLDRLSSEQKKLAMESEAMDSRAEQQKNQLEQEKQNLAAAQAKLDAQKKAMEQGQPAAGAKQPAPVAAPPPQENRSPLSERYKLVNVMGMGKQLQATVEDLNTGQRKKIWAGKTLDDYAVKAISLDEGVVLVRDGETQTLGVGK
ncbi:MAG: type IV pilus biogenesis protein PilP [Proteobacteria bacterium]|nr:type IV pilus biogenesis protein PilP [Pseudomonadota bacterium]